MTISLQAGICSSVGRSVRQALISRALVLSTPPTDSSKHINYNHRMKTNLQLSTALLSGVFALGSSLAVNAQNNPAYAPGDLVLFFQKPGDDDTVYVNLGKAATEFRGSAAGTDAPNKIEFVDISATLVSAFGSGWASDPAIYAGLAGVFSTNNTNGTSAPDGDPFRTLYISQARSAPGTPGQVGSTPWDLAAAGNSNMTTAATGIQSQNNVLENNFTTGIAIATKDVSQIDDQNPLVSAGIPPVIIQDPAMGGALNGGIQQIGSASAFGTMGAAGSVEFALDLYRVLARNTVTGQVAGDLRVGSFEGTVVVGTNGKVSFLSSDFATWAMAYPGLDTASKRAAGADPDGDGLQNQVEFVLGGNPTSGSGDPVPTVDASGSNFVFTFPRRDDSENQITLEFQYGSDLGTWTTIAVGSSNSVAGSAVVTVTENSGAQDSISISIPKSSFPGGKLFGRLKAGSN